MIKYLFTFLFLISTTYATEITLTSKNSVAFLDEFNEVTCAEAIEKIRELDSKLPAGEPIYIVLYTPGGEIIPGLTFFDVTAGIQKKRPIHTVTMFAASMGFQTVHNFGTRYITPYGVLMSHKAAGGMSGEFGPSGSQLDQRYDLWKDIVLTLDNLTVKRNTREGGLTLEKYRAEMENEMWLLGQKAVNLGYADEVVSPICDASLDGTFEKKVNFMGITIFITYSKCPLNPLILSFRIIMPVEEAKKKNYFENISKVEDKLKKMQQPLSSTYKK